MFDIFLFLRFELFEYLFVAFVFLGVVVCVKKMIGLDGFK